MSRRLQVLVAVLALVASSVPAALAQGVTILVPPPGLQPFADLSSTLPQYDPGTYTIRYEGAPGRVGQFGGYVTLAGSFGSAKFDERLLYAATVGYSNCAPDAAYCASAVVVGGPQTREIFRGLRVGGSSAIAEHITCCNGHYWLLAWYSAPANTTYTLDFGLGVADRYSGQALDPGNVTAAQAIADIAAQLVPLR